MATETITQFLKGGEFVIRETSSKGVFIPEQISEEQVMFRNMARDFVNSKVMPKVKEIDKQDFDLVVALLEECGELGLLGTGLPADYGGMGVDFITETFLAEEIGPTHSFSVAVSAHTGIGTLPVLYFGTEEQKKKYLPDLAMGKLKAAYCLTEPGSGSDALAAKTKAVLSEDGEHFIITGQKMWITNSGFADLFTVFAQVQEDDRIEGKGFTGFLVEANRENINLGNEEDKMGIKGSSTRQVFFEGVKIPKENLLGEIGRGHAIAFNVLNIGRYKLGVLAVGGSKAAVDSGTKYAKERMQFGVPIASFGAIQYKIAEESIRTFASESATYRVAGLIGDYSDSLKAEGISPGDAKRKAAEEYAIECALIKVLCSETLDYCVDETVQIYGGNGFSEEFPAARAYRDARINRIFEGTNEINRLLGVGMLIKKAMKGELDVMNSVMEVSKSVPELLQYKPDFAALKGGVALEKEMVSNIKKALLLITGAAVQKFQSELEKEQQIVMNLSDMLIELLMIESTVLRVEALIDRGMDADIKLKIMKAYCSDALERFYLHGKHGLQSFAEGENLVALLKVLKNLTRYELHNTKKMREDIAAYVIEANGYTFSDK